MGRRLRGKADKIRLYKWTREILVGLGTYALLLKEGEGRSEAKEANKDTSVFLSDDSFSIRIKRNRSSESYLRIQRGQRDEYWGRDRWETLPEGHAKAMVTDSYITRFFFILLIRAFLNRRPDSYTLKALTFRKLDVLTWNFTEEIFEQKFRQASEDARYAGLGTELSEIKDRIKEFLKQVTKEADLRSELDLVEKKISDKRKEDVISGFAETFPSAAKMGCIFIATHTWEQKLTPEEDALKWGINTLLPRVFRG